MSNSNTELTERVPVLMPDDLKSDITEYCDRHGLSVSEFLREQARETVRTSHSEKDQLEKRLEEKQEKLERLEDERDEVNREIEQVSKTITHIQQQLQAIRQSTEEYESLVAELAELRVKGYDNIQASDSFDRAVEVSQKSVEAVMEDIEAEYERLKESDDTEASPSGDYSFEDLISDE